MDNNTLIVPEGAYRLEQYQGPWAIVPDTFRALIAQLGATSWGKHVTAFSAARAAGDSAGYGMPNVELLEGGIAVMDVGGVLTKYGSSFGEMSGVMQMTKQMKSLERNAMVSSIILRIDSPGGSVMGIDDFAQAVANANKTKPVVAYIEDLGASAAYWVASQAGKIYTNNAASVGSIGVYSVVHDFSEMYKNEGVKTYVISTGELKGACTPGTEITDEQLAERQAAVDNFNSIFLSAISKGRKMPIADVRKIATGAVWLAGDAHANGLTDGIKSFEKVVAELRATKITPKGAKSMSETNGQSNAPATPQAATYHELKAALIGADAGFITSQLDASATVQQATMAWMGEQSKRVNEANAKAEKAEADAKLAAAGGKSGVQVIGDNITGKPDASASSSPIEQWQEEVAAETKRNGGDPQAATRTVRRRNPELAQAYNDAYNAIHNPKKEAK